MSTLIEAIQELGKHDWWDYVQLFVTIISLIIATLSIYCAVMVPKKIAENQNKISLFEKRYEVFQFFEKCFVFKNLLQQSETWEERKKNCLYFLDLEDEKILNTFSLMIKITHFEYILHQMEFLFPGLNESDVCSLYKALERVIIDIASNQKNKKSLNVYIETMGNFANSYNKIIWDNLYLQKEKRK